MVKVNLLTLSASPCRVKYTVVSVARPTNTVATYTGQGGASGLARVHRPAGLRRPPGPDRVLGSIWAAGAVRTGAKSYTQIPFLELRGLYFPGSLGLESCKAYLNCWAVLKSLKAGFRVLKAVLRASKGVIGGIWAAGAYGLVLNPAPEP